MRTTNKIDRFVLWLCGLLVCFACAPSTPGEGIESAASATTATFVQASSAVPQTPQANVGVAFGSAQTAGNLNVVIVGWSDTVASVTSVTDTAGNVYTLTVGPNVAPGFITQSIFYAKNIVAAASNTVTAHFDSSAQFVDVRILEYSGLDTSNPLDAAAGANGTDLTSSATVVTTNANDLLVAGNTVATTTSGAGTGFTQRVITSPDGDIAEDMLVTATGSYAATAPLTSDGAWVMQVVAFRLAGATPPPPVLSNVAAGSITATSASITWTSSTPTTSVVDFGTTTSYGQSTPVNTTLLTSHQAVLLRLTASTSFHYRVRGVDASNQQATSGDFTFTTAPPPDTTPPSVAITSPAAGATLSSTVNITAFASDDVGVVGVKFFVDGIQVGAEQTALPYTVAWDTAGGTNGQHTLTATARDAANNSGSSIAVTVDVNNGVTPPQVASVQTNSTVPQASLSTVTLPYASAQVAGDTNVVAVGWNDATSTVTSVTDSAGNTYTRAVGPTLYTGPQGQMSQSIYYASNIVAAAAGANTLTVRFSGAAAFPDIRSLEYHGLATAGVVDVTAAATGTSTTSDSGRVTTTNANDLLFGANMVTGGTNGPGAGYTSRVITSPDSDIAEDRIVTTTASYNADASTSNCGWIMQLVAFKAAPGT